MKIKVFKVLVLFILIICSMNILSYATGESKGIELTEITTGMSGVGTVTKTDGKIAKVINRVIRLIQIAGSGISLIVVTILGVKYMLASSGEKADIKKMAVPIVIGCVLLFSASNLVAIIAGMGDGLNS